MTNTHDTASRYRLRAKEFSRVVDSLTNDQWAAASPCTGWTARDVLDHVVDTQREFCQRHNLDIGERPTASDPGAIWREHSTRVADLLTPEVATIEITSPFGRTTIGATVDRFYGFDLLAHRWDIAAAVGAEHRFADHELSDLETAIAEFGDNLYHDGVCASPIPVSDDADRQSKVLAALGRRGQVLEAES